MDENNLEELKSRNWERELNRRLIKISNKKQRFHRAMTEWIDNMGQSWDIACCWHVPIAMRVEQNGYSAEWLQRHLQAYLNRLRNKVYSHLPRSQRPVLPRFISIEWSAGVGWHAHGLMSTPGHLTADEMMELAKDAWMKHIGRFATNRFAKRLVWMETRKGGYSSYTVKRGMEIETFNWDGSKGFIDLDNTART